MSDTILITRLTFGVFRTLQAVVMCVYSQYVLFTSSWTTSGLSLLGFLPILVRNVHEILTKHHTQATTEATARCLAKSSQTALKFVNTLFNYSLLLDVGAFFLGLEELYSPQSLLLCRY
jgi:F0F1-type ATP synthase assembly protein I